MGRSMRALVALVAAVAVAGSACVSGEEIPAMKDPDDVVRQAGTVGTSVDYFGIDGSVLAMEAFDQSNDGFPRLRVTMRTQSHLEVPSENPTVAIRCDESAVPGDWYRGSTWESSGILPGGRIHEGQIILGFPPKEGAERYPVPTCTNGRVEVVGANSLDRDQKVITSYPIPPEMITTAIDAPRQ